MAALDMLLQVLDQAVSQDPQVVKFAEEKLREWEDKPEFYKTLLDICFNETLPPQIRWIAILFFKNGIEKYWRRVVNRILTEEDKHYLKAFLISSFTEPVNQISLQLAVVIGRVARTDLKTWPDLIPKLLQEVRSQESVVQYNSLLTLNHVIKGLVSKRLASDRKVFKDVSCALLGFVLELWMHHSNQFVSHLSSNQMQSAEESLKMSVLSLKVLQKLVVEGTCDEVMDSSLTLLKVLVERIPNLLTLRSQFLSVHNIGEKLEKLILIGMKTLLGTLDRQPFLFVDVLESSLNMAIKFSFVCLEKDVLYEKFIVQCINLIKKAIKCKDYKRLEEPHLAEATRIKIQKAQEIKQSIFNKDLLVELCQQLVFKYFPLTSQEINEWEGDPESFLTEEAGESADYLIRPCTENLFLCLYYEYRSTFTEVLGKMVNHLNAPYNKEDLECLRLREAVYFALGLASYELFDEFNFDKYFQESLIFELRDASARMNIVSRRILWLIGRWIDVSFGKESRILLYTVLVKMLDRKEDLVVRITASRTLKDAVDDYQFEIKDILPYLKDLWERLFCLLIDVQECDTKVGVLNVISILIERAKGEMKMYASALCEYLPHLWADSAEHNMLRCVVVSTLKHVVEALGSESVNLHSLLLSVIHLCTDQSQPSHVYLLDDGLDLWLSLMQNSPEMSPDLLALFSVLPTLLEQTSENFKTCISIIKSYLYLDAANVLKMHSSSLVGIINTLLGEMKDKGNVLLTELVQIMLILLPNETLILFESVLKKIFKFVLEDQVYPRVMTSYLTISGYVLLHNSTAFFSILQRYCSDANEKPERAAAQFVDVWLEKVDFISDDKSRKMTAMALVSLLPLNAELVNERFALILDTVVNVLHGSSNASFEDQTPALINSSGSLDHESLENMESLEGQRKKQFMVKDIGCSLSLLDFVKMKINEAKIALGDESFRFHMDTLDSTVSKQLLSLLG